MIRRRSAVWRLRKRQSGALPLYHPVHRCILGWIELLDQPETAHGLGWISVAWGSQGQRIGLQPLLSTTRASGLATYCFVVAPCQMSTGHPTASARRTHRARSQLDACRSRLAFHRELTSLAVPSSVLVPAEPDLLPTAGLIALDIGMTGTCGRKYSPVLQLTSFKALRRLRLNLTTYDE